MNTKIALSDKELELVCNAGWILTKHAVIQKVYDLFGEIAQQQNEILRLHRDHLPAVVFTNPPKISRGENYRLLPYVMLDYPRYFAKEETAAIRTFFWWGNFFSVSIQVAGIVKEKLQPLWFRKFEWLQSMGYYVCVHDEPWEHHFDTGNFVPLNAVEKDDFCRILQEKSFIKLSKKIPLQRWQDAPVFIRETFEEMTGLLCLY